MEESACKSLVSHTRARRPYILNFGQGGRGATRHASIKTILASSAEFVGPLWCR